MQKKIVYEIQEALSESRTHEFHRKEVNDLWTEYLDSVELLTRKMQESADSLDEWKDLFEALRGFYLYRISLQDDYFSSEENTEELKEITRNMKSSDDYVLPEDEIELCRAQMENAVLEFEIQKGFQYWRDYGLIQAELKVEHINRLADAVKAKLKERESGKGEILDKEVELPLDNDNESEEEEHDDERSDFNWEYLCRRHPAVKLGEIMEDLPGYEAWMATFKSK